MESLDEKIARVVSEHVALVPYDARWPARFEEERRRLLELLPRHLIRRIEHCGSTAVPGLSAKPIVDLLVEVASLEETRRLVPPILEARGYDYFWRASAGESAPPYYAWFIRRDARRDRTHHIHMVEGHFEQWSWLLFRDYLRLHSDVAAEYARVKAQAAERHAADRVAYAAAKSAFIASVTRTAKSYFGAGAPGTK